MRNRPEIERSGQGKVSKGKEKKQSYQQLSLKEREQIAVLKAAGKKAVEISRIINRNKSTVCRELKRNHSGGGHYLPVGAHQMADLRKISACRKNPQKSPEIWSYVKEKILLGWSPEQISGRLTIDHPSWSISYETIYLHVYKDWELIGKLPRQHVQKRRRRRNKKQPRQVIPNRIGIEQRPEVINSRQELGHWESDSVVSGKNKNALNVLLERKSRFVQITPIPNLKACETRAAIIKRLTTFNNPTICLSLTYDNGFENREHERINEVLQSKSYFCQPYHSWEKGAVENMNGLIRRFIPKSTNLAKVTADEIRRIESLLNNRPRKCLGYQTPYEVFNQFYLPVALRT